MSPDLYVDLLPDGRFKVRLAIPQPRIDDFYEARARNQINRRRRETTIVATAIFALQRLFFAAGPDAIELLTMQQIADKVALPLMTVSRSVGDKWVQTPRGTFQLNRFIIAENSTWQLDTSIQSTIQELIDAEDRNTPYSDAQLATQLGKQGFAVPRRTVTRYRKKLGIPSSRQRRRW